MIKSNSKLDFSFLSIAILFLILRTGILLTAVEWVSHYDELDLGTIARDLLTGLKMPFRYYQLDAYSGESLILGPLVVPFFKIFGHNLFAIKMVPLLFSLGTLILLYQIIRNAFHHRAALAAAVLYILGIPVLTQLSLVGMSGHCEAAFLGMLALFFFTKWIMGHFSNPRYLFLFAAASGFSVWFYYENAILVFTCVLAWFLMDRRSFFTKNLLFFAVTALIFFSPWMILNLKSSFSGTVLLREIFNTQQTGSDLPEFLRKNLAILLLGFPSSFAVAPFLGIHEKALSYSSCLGFIVLSGSLYVKSAPLDTIQKRVLLPLKLYPFIFLSIVLFSSLTIVRYHGFVGYRYFTPLFIVLTMLAGVAAVQSKRKFLLWAVLLTVGTLGHLPLFFRETPGAAFNYKGYSYYQLGTRWRMSFPAKLFTSYRDFQQLTLRFSESDRLYLYLGMVDMAIMDHDPALIEEGSFGVDEAIKEEGELFHPFLYEWFGAVRMTTPASVQAYISENHLSERIVRHLCNGWMGNWEQTQSFLNRPASIRDLSFCVNPKAWINFIYLEPDEAQWTELQASMNTLLPDEQSWAYRSIGRAFYLYERFSQVSLMRRFHRLFGSLDGLQRQAVLEGIGWGIRLRFIEDPIRARSWAKKFPSADHPFISSGIEASDHWYQYPL